MAKKIMQIIIQIIVIIYRLKVKIINKEKKYLKINKIIF
jgi:hypothetical protein